MPIGPSLVRWASRPFDSAWRFVPRALNLTDGALPLTVRLSYFVVSASFFLHDQLPFACSLSIISPMEVDRAKPAPLTLYRRSSMDVEAEARDQEFMAGNQLLLALAGPTYQPYVSELLSFSVERLHKLFPRFCRVPICKFMVVHHTAHAIQEDVPEEFTSLILNFISRNRIGPHGVEIPGIWSWKH